MGSRSDLVNSGDLIVLTGTSGGLASVLLDTILEQKLLPTSKLRLSTTTGRTASRKALEERIEVRRGDLKDRSSLVRAYEGAQVLFLVSYPSVGEERFIYHRNAIDAAKEAGIQHILYTSLAFGGIKGEQSVAGVMQAHIQTVRYLKASGLSWTILRYPTYNHLWNNLAGFLQLGDGIVSEVVIAADGPNHWASRRDLGEATAKVLTNWKSYINKTINFTGPELLPIAQIVELYNAYKGTQIAVRVVGEEEAIKYHRQHNTLPPEQEPFLRSWVSWAIALRDGECDYLDPTLEQLLGRKPKTISDMAEELFEGHMNALDTKDFN